jgi:hypothetical protein
MPRLALAFLLLLVGFAPAASAQAPPPDERVAAQAMADATVRFSKAVEDADDEAEEALGPRCAKIRREVPRERRRDYVYILTRHSYRAVAAVVREDLGRLRTDLANAQTRDPALLSGRAAWRQLSRALMALPPAGNLCTELRAWVRDGAPRSEGREALAEAVRVLSVSGREFDRKVNAASRRMIELGVPQSEAESFNSD